MFIAKFIAEIGNLRLRFSAKQSNDWYYFSLSLNLSQFEHSQARFTRAGSLKKYKEIKYNMLLILPIGFGLGRSRLTML